MSLKLKMLICSPQCVCFVSAVPNQPDPWPLTPDVSKVFASTRLPGLVKSRRPWLSPPFYLSLVLCVGVGLNFSWFPLTFGTLFSYFGRFSVFWPLPAWAGCQLGFSVFFLNIYLYLYLENIIQQNQLWLSCFHLELNNLFLILKLFLQPNSSFLTAFGFMLLIENANVLNLIWNDGLLVGLG